MMRKAYITLDYELFMGQNTGTPERCLIEPMKYLVKEVAQYGIKLNIFVDAAYLLRLAQLKDMDSSLLHDYELVTNNIKELSAQGHSIQLHLHPQWLYSQYIDGKWEMDTKHFKLSDMPLDEQRQLISNGVSLLNSLASKPVCAFRAGGYSISNFCDLADTFSSAGIKVDSSVLRGEKARSSYHSYDYSAIAKLSHYNFSNDVSQQDVEGLFTEYPISTIVVPSVLFLCRKHTKCKCEGSGYSLNAWGDGVGIGYPGNMLQQILLKVRKLIGNKAVRATIDGMGGDSLEEVYEYSLRHYNGDDFVIIGHPKLFTPYSIFQLRRFFEAHPELTSCTF